MKQLLVGCLGLTALLLLFCGALGFFAASVDVAITPPAPPAMTASPAATPAPATVVNVAADNLPAATDETISSPDIKGATPDTSEVAIEPSTAPLPAEPVIPEIKKPWPVKLLRDKKTVDGKRLSIDGLIEPQANTLPTRADFEELLYRLEKNRPGLKSYWVRFYLPGMKQTGSPFAIVHKLDGNLKITVDWQEAPEEFWEMISTEFRPKDIPKYFEEQKRLAQKAAAEEAERKATAQEAAVLNAYFNQVNAENESILVEEYVIQGDRLKISMSLDYGLAPGLVRKVIAENLQSVWASLHSPSDPDRSRISIFCGRTEVAGSRILGGTLIWVAD